MGDRLAQKIMEIVSTGELRRLEAVDKERERIIDMFKNIHGVGQVTAQQFYAQVGGFMGVGSILGVYLWGGGGRGTCARFCMLVQVIN